MSTLPPFPESFCDVLHAELNEIEKSRKGRKEPSPAPGATQSDAKSREGLAGIPLPLVTPQDGWRDHLLRARESELLGLAFSGGGIRSATFNLGILQGLAKYRLLPRFDYLSTVSGGGYIGSWFTAWIKRKGLKKVQEELAGDARSPRTPEPREINFLRQYSNYLTPKTGAFSADTWTMVSIYLRNLLLNLTILVCALGAGVLLVRLLSHLTAVIPRTEMAFWVLALIGTVALLIAAVHAFRSIMVLSQDCPQVPYASENYQGAVQRRVVIPILVAAWALSSTVISASSEWRWYFVLGAISIAVLGILIPVLFALLIRLWRWIKGQRPGDPLNALFIAKSCVVAVIGGAVTGGGLYLLFPHLRGGFGHWSPVRRLEFLTAPEAQFIWGIPLVVALLLIGGTFYIGAMGANLNAKHREWWARVGAWLHIYSLGWLAVSLVTLTGPWIVSQMDDWGKMAFTSAWLGTTIGGLLAGNSTATDKPGSNRGLELLAGLAPVVFVVGLLVVLSAAVKASLTWGEAQYDWPAPSVCLAALAAFSFVAALLSWRVDINEFSMHHFYRDRLVRCYLGASNDSLNPHPFTGFDPIEHYLRISDLQCNQPVDPKDEAHEPRPDKCSPKSSYVGPYYLVNTAMNLVSGKNLAWQQRMATSFVFTPKHAGFAFHLPEPKQLKAVEAFRPTEKYIGGISLGSAVAISGAAASPNMGYHSSKALAFLMTVFNVRLGWWFGNPKKNSWDQPSPPFNLAYLFMELFGFTNEDSEFIYLSDGGHFENLGIYELVRRRCRFIIACDASQDGDLEFGDLGNAIEKCRTDLGIGVTINVDPIRCPADSKMSKRHCAVGTIHYEHVDKDAPQGILIYIKASLTGDEPTDVLRYSAMNKIFPHQSTSDQFFNESQFESYRALGQHIVDEVLNGAGDTAAVHQMPANDLFLALKRYWYPSSVRVESHFSKHAAKVDAIYHELRTSRNLAFLSQQIYPEWRKLVAGKAECEQGTYWLPESCDEIREGFYICNQVIQLMEGVYVDLNLDQENDHPDNRGWMNFFRHWSWSGMFRVTWAISAATYGARFQTFCQRHLDLKIGDVEIGDEISGTSTKPPDWNDLEAKLVLNFYERQLLEKLIKFDIGQGRLQNYSVYPLVLKVAIPTRPKDERIDFNFGFALVYGTGEASTLRFFRVQDHLRNMGLGRRGLTALINEMRLAGLGANGYPGDESKNQVEIAAKKAKGLVEEEGSGIRFPSTEERQLMRALFESVQAQFVQETEQKKEQED